MQADAYFLKTIDIARTQQAQSPELRAVMSLNRLWHQQGKRDEVRQLWTAIYDWFTEGFDSICKTCERCSLTLPEAQAPGSADKGG